MKILLLGHTGQVGHEIQRQLGNTATLVAPDRASFDLVSPHSIEMQVREIAPDLIINAAAYTGVDQSETDVTLAQQINGAAPGYLAAAAQSVGAAMLHLSTDYVFNGSQSSPYSEADPPSPLGVYGQSKWVGEQSVQAQSRSPHYSADGLGLRQPRPRQLCQNHAEAGARSRGGASGVRPSGHANLVSRHCQRGNYL